MFSKAQDFVDYSSNFDSTHGEKGLILYFDVSRLVLVSY